MHNFKWVSRTMSKFRKNDTIPQKHLDRQKDGWKDRMMDRPYFIGPFQLLPGIQQRSNLTPPPTPPPPHTHPIKKDRMNNFTLYH